MRRSLRRWRGARGSCSCTTPNGGDLRTSIRKDALAQGGADASAVRDDLTGSTGDADTGLVGPAEIDAYRARTRLIRTLIWWTGLLASVGIGLAVGFLWSFVAGIPLACALALLWLRAFLRLDQTTQIKRFPALRGQKARWRRRYFL